MTDLLDGMASLKSRRNVHCRIYETVEAVSRFRRNGTPYYGGSRPQIGCCSAEMEVNV